MAGSEALAGLAGLPSEVILNIASFCPYSTVLSLERTCRAFQGLVNDLSLLRQIVETVYHSCRFSNAGIWSSVHLDLWHAKSVCIALEMALRSEGKSAVAIETFLRSRVILAIHSHPLTGAVDLNALQFCLHVARYYKVHHVIPDIAFCLIAATLERGIFENHFCELKGVTPSETDSMVVIAFLVVSLHRDSLKEIKETLLRPRLSLIPFEALLGELPSFLMGLDGTKSFTWRLQSSITPSFLDCEWVGVYLRDWDTLYELNSVQLVKRSGDTPLQVRATINQQPWEIESENYVMTPFGIVVFWQMGASWLWKKEWCDGNFAFARRLPNHEHEPDFISCSIKLTLGQDFWALVNTNGDLEFHKDHFNLEDAHAMTVLNETYSTFPLTRCIVDIGYS